MLVTIEGKNYQYNHFWEICFKNESDDHNHTLLYDISNWMLLKMIIS